LWARVPCGGVTPVEPKPTGTFRAKEACLVGEIWAKFNKNERNVSFGAAIVIVGWLVSLVSNYSFGVGFLAVVGAVAVLAIYYLKYTNSTIQWPAPIETIVLAISGVIAIVAVLQLIGRLGVLSFAGIDGGIYVIALLAITAGAVLMAFGAWQEYQVKAGYRPPTTSASSAQPPAAPSAPAAPPPTESAPPPPSGDGNPPA
jgi:hypothetical protein